MSLFSSLGNMLGNVVNSRSEPFEAEWYDNVIAIVKRGLADEELSDNDIEALWDLNAHIRNIVKRHEELRLEDGGRIVSSPTVDLNTRKLRNAVVNLSRGKPLSYFDRKLLEELCVVLADVRASKTGFEITDVTQDGDKLHVKVGVRPAKPLEHIEVNFFVEPSQTHVESKSELEQSIARQITAKVRDQVGQALTAQIAAKEQWTPTEMSDLIQRQMQSQLQGSIGATGHMGDQGPMSLAQYAQLQEEKSAMKQALEQIAQQPPYYTSEHSEATASNVKESA